MCKKTKTSTNEKSKQTINRPGMNNSRRTERTKRKEKEVLTKTEK